VAREEDGNDTIRSFFLRRSSRSRLFSTPGSSSQFTQFCITPQPRFWLQLSSWMTSSSLLLTSSSFILFDPCKGGFDLRSTDLDETKTMLVLPSGA
jgi:hypothetical protein